MPPLGYSPYPVGAGGPATNDGLAVAGFVLALVGVIPCFWVVQIPGLLALVFGLVGRSRIAASGGRKKGAGLALAAAIIGAVLVALALVLIVALVAGDGTITIDSRG
jgi:hypothetical protein